MAPHDNTSKASTGPAPTAVALGAGALRAYSKAEIAKHNTVNDAWVSCNGFVFDVTNFMDSHPGGKEVLLDSLGSDIKAKMLETDHSPYAYTFMKDFTIGTVEGETPHEMFEAPPKHMRGYKLTDINRCVDFAKPALYQIVHLGDKYWPWISNRPVVHHMRMFHYDFLELLSRWPWWYIWGVWLPLSIFGIWSSFNNGFSTQHTALAWIFGWFLWTFFEYNFHRHCFHYPVSTNFGNFVHYFLHGVHHLTPTDSSRLTFPPPFTTIIAFVTWNAIKYLTPSAFSSAAIYAGFVWGYLLYDTVHVYYHSHNYNNKVFKWLKSYHLGRRATTWVITTRTRIRTSA